MTSDEFFAVLETSKDQGFDWFYKEMSFKQNLIRAKKKTNGMNTFCPITVVAYIVLGRHFQVTEWSQAMHALEFDELEGCQIMRAADKSGEFLSGDKKALRDRLLSVTEPHAEVSEALR